MNKKSTKNILLIVLISIFLLVFNIFIKKKIFLFAESTMASFMIIITFISILMFGFQKDKNNKIKSNLFYKTAQIIVVYFIIIYLLGLYFGFSKIVFSLRPQSIINNTFAPIITFVALELFRYVIINGNRDNKKIIVILNILIGLIELSISTKYLHFSNLESSYKTIADFIIPITVKQISLSYVCYYGGLKSQLLYRIVTILYTYVIPIHPNFPSALICMCNIIVPLIILIKANDIVNEEKREKDYIKKDKSIFDKLTEVICLLVLASLVILITGITPIGITAIATDSMYPAIKKGSAVITIKTNADIEFKQGDIISFNRDNMKIIHRINSILVDGDEIRYYTKGDANNSLDEGYITYKDIDSKIIFSIPLIGYPAVIIEDILH